MRAQRRPGSAPAIHGTAERIPLGGCERRRGHVGAVRSALARSSGGPRGDAADRAPARRSADIRRTSARAVLAHPRLPHRVRIAAERQRSEPARAGCQRPEQRFVAVPVPHDCADGLARSRSGGGRLRTSIRRCGPGSASSTFSIRRTFRARWRGSPTISRAAPGLERNRDLLELDELDLGLRLVVWEKDRYTR